MNEREKTIRLWFDMWLNQQDMGIDDIFTEDVKIEEMEKESYRLVTMSFWGTERAVLVFKKGLKGSLL